MPSCVEDYFPMQLENKICQHSSLAHSRGDRECDFHRSSVAQWKVSKGLSWTQGPCWASGGIWVRCQMALGDLLPPPHQKGLSSRGSEPPGAPETGAQTPRTESCGVRTSPTPQLAEQLGRAAEGGRTAGPHVSLRVLGGNSFFPRSTPSQRLPALSQVTLNLGRF